MTPCPDEATILAFGRGDGDPAMRAAVDFHVTECDECRSLVSAVVRSSSMLPKAKPFEIAPTAPATPVHGSGGSAPPMRTSSASSVVAPVKEGDVLAGKYVVERVLGAGGMGIVVAARHLQLDQRFALKFLLPAACQVPDAVARFIREGKAAAQIASEHVARVVDTGVLDTGAPFLVMEYLEGHDLGSITEPLSVEDAVEYVLQASEAIVEAHQLGIVHRDLKPPNLFLARRKDGSPLVKVLDFGISKVADGLDTPQLTNTSMMMGSPRYMSPEQMVSTKDVDARTDVWALGVILFELVTGQPVWEADTVQGLCALIATAQPPSLRKYVRTAPELLDEVISRCLAKTPDQRVASVADLALLLAPFANAPAQTSIDRILRVAGRSRSIPIPRPPKAAGIGPLSSVTPPAAVSQIPATSIHSNPRPPSSARVIGGLAAVIALVGLGATGALLYKKEPPPPPPSAASSPTPAIASSAPVIPIIPVIPVVSAGALASASAAPSAKPLKPKHRPPAVSAGAAPAPAPPPTPEGPSTAYTDRK